MGGIKGKIGLMASSFIMMSFLAPNSVLARIAESFPDTPLETVQMLTTMPSLIALVLTLVVGKVTPYLYKRTLIFISMGFYIVGGLLPYFFHQNIWCLLLGAGILGIGLGTMLTCVPALICDCYSEKECGVLMGFQAAFISGGGMVFIWLGGRLGSGRWENCFLAYLAVAAVLLIDLFCLPKGKLEGRKTEISASEKAKVPGSIWFYAGLGFILYLFITIYNSNVPMLVEIRSFGGPAEASYASICYTFAGMVAGCVNGAVLAKIKKWVFPVAVLLGFLGMLLSFFSGQLWVLCLAGMFCGASFATFTPAGTFYTAQSAGGEQNRSFCIAIFNSIINFGQAISPLAIAFLMRPLTIEQRFLGAAAAFAVLFALAVAGVYGLAKRRTVSNRETFIRR